MPIRIQFRRSTATEWTAANPILAQGELALETDTRKFKLGDGVTAWNNLGYASSQVGSLGDILDVDLSSLTDGSLLVYDANINKWVATKNLEKQNLNGGFW